MSSVESAAVWAVSACAVGGILVRPRRTPEWVWAVAGGALAAAVSAMSAPEVARAVMRGADVYAFLIGILSLAELARAERVFDVIALRFVGAAGGSQARLFAWIYGAGTLVTALLSNDTTVVVLTPAVLAVLGRTDVTPLPYLYACAFVANAASFLLPVSNPANLVLFGHGLPSLLPWLQAFGGAAIAAIVLTYAALRLFYRQALHEPYHVSDPTMGRTATWTAALLTASAAALIAASALGVNVGYTALGAAAVCIAATGIRAPASAAAALQQTTWSIVPLVAGLFVIVAALDRSGAINLIRTVMVRSESLATGGVISIGAVVTIASNLFNNLPVALASGVAVQSTHVAPRIADATLVAVDLGPNLSVSGSLATLLWLVVLRREGINVTAWQFLQVGALVLLPALVAALLLVR
ncbi:MAG: arsenic transporter [Candidatus Eremiobacteraeota bacterium]|nr:arsenic transporter [Candidatus Eremiobacteraeota bacterium]